MIILGIISILLSIVIIYLLKANKGEGFLQFKNSFESLHNNQERTERIVREDIALNREELSKTLNTFRQEFSGQINQLTESNEKKLESVREIINERLQSIEKENSQKLEKMRETVDEKLHATLERRLGESFQVVSDRLEKVYQGLGEMQTLASGVGDLKKVLSNVKTRGILGEVQLEN
ncbi:DNA recombination protein RmuC, partial [hydrothermal vent metagenome]